MKTEPKLLMLLTPGFPSSESDTTCLPMQQQFARCMQERFQNLKVVVLTLQYPYCKASYRWNGITVMSFNGRNRGGIKRWLLRKRLDKLLEEMHLKEGIAGMISFWLGECAWVGKKFADRFKVPHVCWLMGQDARAGNPYPAKLNLAPSEIVALSDFLQDEFEKNHGVRPLHVIPPGIDSRLFPSAAKEKTIDLIAAGSLIALKRFDILIDILAGIKTGEPGIRAFLIGEGPEKKKLMEKAKQLGVFNNITFTGELSYPDVLELMSRAKVLVHPSTFEGYSGVCLEALASGCRVVSFCQPMRSPVNGWSIVKNVEEMEKEVVRLLASDDQTRFEQRRMEETVDLMFQGLPMIGDRWNFYTFNPNHTIEFGIGN